MPAGSCDACGVEESEYDPGVYANLNLGHMAYKIYLIDMEGDSYRLRKTLRNNGTDFETVVKW